MIEVLKRNLPENVRSFLGTEWGQFTIELSLWVPVISVGAGVVMMVA